MKHVKFPALALLDKRSAFEEGHCKRPEDGLEDDFSVRHMPVEEEVDQRAFFCQWPLGRV